MQGSFSAIHLLDSIPPISRWKKRAKPRLPTCRRGGRHLAVRSSFVGCLGQSCISQGICLSDKTWRPTLAVQSPRPCTNSSKSQHKSSGLSHRQLSFVSIHRLCRPKCSLCQCFSWHFVPLFLCPEKNQCCVGVSCCCVSYKSLDYQNRHIGSIVMSQRDSSEVSRWLHHRLFRHGDVSGSLLATNNKNSEENFRLAKMALHL